MAETTHQYQLNKTAFRISTLAAEGGDRAFWFSITPAERLAAMEHLRQIAYGYDPETQRIERVLKVVERARRQ